jgi:hypothetical protein
VDKSIVTIFSAVILSLVAGVGAVNAMVALNKARASLPEHPWRRIAFLVALVIIGVAVAVASYLHQRATPPVITATTTGDSPQPTTTHQLTPPITAPSTTNRTVLPPRARAASPRIRISNDTGEDDVELNSTAEQAACAGCRVRGRLSIATTVEHQLQDIVTANLRLSLTITQSDGRERSFTLTSRGGGFTRDVAIDQARERMAASLTESLRATQ